LTTPAAAAKRRCCVCERPGVPRGRTWCRECQFGYQLASRILLAYQDRRTPARDAVVRRNIKRYRRRASLGLPIFGGP
jgi:hypothetical protein